MDRLRDVLEKDLKNLRKNRANTEAHVNNLEEKLVEAQRLMDSIDINLRETVFRTMQRIHDVLETHRNLLAKAKAREKEVLRELMDAEDGLEPGEVGFDFDGAALDAKTLFDALLDLKAYGL